ncbi:MAG: hypothetical protein ABSC47_03980 [Terracidiphilus sp.]
MATIDERFQSYNIEMVEVTGGRFWKPYDTPAAAGRKASNQQPDTTQSDTDPSRFQYRPPIDLANARLRKLAAAHAGKVAFAPASITFLALLGAHNASCEQQGARH